MDDHISLYYLGGPRDCSKEFMFGPPLKDRIVVRSVDRIVPSTEGSSNRLAEYSEHTYLLRRVGRSTWVAIYEPLL